MPRAKRTPKTTPSDLRVTRLPLADLTPYPRNPRHITPAAVNAVAESLAEFGWQQPIVIDPKRVIVAGHTRHQAALQLGWTHAPTVTIAAKHARAYRLADNRSGEFSTWDLDVLPGELAALPAAQLEALPALDFSAVPSPPLPFWTAKGSTYSDEWYTPSMIIEAARECMGQIDLDPASCKAAQRTVKATQYFTAKDDGLVQPWSGRVWCNPPFSCKALWCQRLVEYAGPWIALLPNTGFDARAVQAVIEVVDVILLVARRLAFWQADNPDGKAGNVTGSVVFGRGVDVGRFVAAYRPYGHILAPIRPSDLTPSENQGR